MAENKAKLTNREIELTAKALNDRFGGRLDGDTIEALVRNGYVSVYDCFDVKSYRKENLITDLECHLADAKGKLADAKKNVKGRGVSVGEAYWQGVVDQCEGALNLVRALER